MGQKAQQIDRAKKQPLRRGEKNSVMNFGWCKECEDVSCLSLKGTAISFSEKLAEATDNVPAERLEKRQEPFEHDVVLGVCFTPFDFTPCGDKGDRVEISITQRARLDAWNATVMTCLTEWEGQKGHRQKVYADIFLFYVTVAIRQYIGPVGSFLKVQEPD